MASFLSAVTLGLLASSLAQATEERPYSSYVLTPRSRTLIPHSVYQVNGTVDTPEGLTAGGISTFNGPSAVTYDFGKNVAGLVSFSTGAVSGANGFVGVSFTESALWINVNGSDETGDYQIDEALWWRVGNYSDYGVSKEHQRGGFRYLNVYHNGSGYAVVANLSVFFSAIPHVSEAQLGVYKGYFHSDDDKVNRVWYAGAYTTELCTIDPTAGNALRNMGVHSESPLPWGLINTIANGSSVLVDGAKRDRLVWPGDMSIAVMSLAVSTYDMMTVRNSLDSLFALQAASGALPYAGTPFPSTTCIDCFSFTYHLHTLNGVYIYNLWTAEGAYLATLWPAYKRAVEYALSFVDSSGLANVTSSYDWLRSWMGGHNIAANALLFHVLKQAIQLAADAGDTADTARWTAIATSIQTAANSVLWDPAQNLYRDNDTLPLSNLYPQDGNVWAVISNLTGSPARDSAISDALHARWTPYGPPAPEAGPTVSPFISGFELQAHYIANHPEHAVSLMRTMWADFMLDDPRMTNSTFVEGFSTTGELHYPPYWDDARLSHAHGWSAGPTSALTLHAVGLSVTKGAGNEWSLRPQLGGLRTAKAAFETVLGMFSASVEAKEDGSMVLAWATPAGTVGQVNFRSATRGKLVITREAVTGQGGWERTYAVEKNGNGLVVEGLEGGKYSATLTVGT